MARMYPDSLRDDAPASERKAFDAFRNGLPEDFIVLHSKRYVIPQSPTRQPREGESDFLIFDPRRGFLVIEVKGGGIERDSGGRWYTVNPRGRFPIKDPGRQAQDQVNDLFRYLKDHGAFANLRVPPFHWGVSFPDFTISKDLGPELPRAITIDAADLKDPARAIADIFNAKGIRENSEVAKSKQAFLKVLAPTFRLVPTLASRLDDEYPILVRLTEEQMDILDTMGEINRLAIKGSAGTGKTLVAMEQARRLAEQGQRVLLMCYNQPLAQHLAQRADGFTVSHFHAFASQAAKRSGIKFDPPKGGAPATEFWDEEAPNLLDQALDLYPDDRWDAVIIDEGQDFKELWWLPIERLLKSPKSSLWVFFDPNQDIYGGGPAETLGLSAAKLTFNCRNTKRIAEYSSRLVGIDPKLKAGAPEGVEVRQVLVDSKQEMLEVVRKSLSDLVGKEQIANDRILLLSPNSAQNSDVMRVGKFGNLTLVEWPTKPGPSQVQFSSIGRFKGLDQDVVILCEVKPRALNASERHLYVGSSRARLLLTVVKYTS